jgi:hypothetical protein
MSSIRASHLLKQLAVAASVAAIFAPSVQAHTQSSGEKYLDGWAANALYNASHPTMFMTENTRGQNPPAARRPAAANRMITDNSAGSRGSGFELAVGTSAASASAGFDWSDAAIGAVAAAGLVLVVSVAMFARRGRTRLAGL